MSKFVRLPRSWTLLLVALVTVLAVALPMMVRADNVQNDVLVGGNDTFILGGSTTISYRIAANNGDGLTGCNASDGSPAVVTINTPAGVTASPNSLRFNACGTFLPTVLTATAAENYSITVSVSDPGVGTYNTNPATFTLKVLSPPDSTPPGITANVTGTLGNNGWYTSDVTVSWTVVENESTITSTSGCDPTTINADTVGQPLTCSATSAGGTSSESVTIKRDATAPTISGSASPAPNANGWNNSDVTVAFICADALSGLASCGPGQTLSSDGAGQSVSGTATDNAGNSASATVSGIDIDKTAPTASASASPAPNGNGWNNTNVTVSFNGSDATSGIASCDTDVVLSSEGAGQSASGSCTDKADNISAPATASGIDIDKTAPTLAPSVSPNPVLLGGSASATPGATDNLSGIDSASCAVPDTSSVGPKTVSCTATDNAGNTANANSSASYSVIYSWTGFFQPVENPGPGPTYVFNRVKAGSAIPMKFSLGGNQGLTIFMAGYPKSELLNCSSSASMDDLTETVNAGGSSLSYDASTDEYNYVWKTEKSWATKCRKLIVKLIDGTDHEAYFNFTK